MSFECVSASAALLLGGHTSVAVPRCRWRGKRLSCQEAIPNLSRLPARAAQGSHLALQPAAVCRVLFVSSCTVPPRALSSTEDTRGPKSSASGRRRRNKHGWIGRRSAAAGESRGSFRKPLHACVRRRHPTSGRKERSGSCGGKTREKGGREEVLFVSRCSRLQVSRDYLLPTAL